MTTDGTPSDAAARRRRMKIAVLLCGGVGAVLACELGLRLTGRYTPHYDLVECSRPEFYEPHETLGYRLHPSMRTTEDYPLTNPRTLQLVTNRDGFRSSREFDEDDPRPRIVALGDSFVYGAGVEEAERFTDVVEELRPEWRVDSVGMSGWGPDLMLRALEEVGLPLRPAVVLLCVYTDDFRRLTPHYPGVGFHLPRYELRDGRLETVPYPVPSALERLRLVQLAQRILSTDAAERRQRRDLMTAILDRLRALGDEHGFTPAIVFVPGRVDADHDKSRREWLRTYADAHGVPFLDVTDAIHAAGDAAFIPGNWHYNPRGHRILAEALAPFLEGTLPRDE